VQWQQIVDNTVNRCVAGVRSRAQLGFVLVNVPNVDGGHARTLDKEVPRGHMANAAYTAGHEHTTDSKAHHAPTFILLTTDKAPALPTQSPMKLSRYPLSQ